MYKSYARLVRRLFVLLILVFCLALLLSVDGRRNTVVYAVACCYECQRQELYCINSCGGGEQCEQQCRQEFGIDYCYRHCTYSCEGMCTDPTDCPLGYTCSDYTCVPW